MKKTKNIDLSMMRKTRFNKVCVKPLALAVAAITLSACSSKEQVNIVGSVSECVDKTKLTFAQCEVAYKKAVAEAERTGPRYTDKPQCETDFGESQCYNPQNNQRVFMPMMTGFMIGHLLSNRSDSYYRGAVYNPIYHYRNPSSSRRDRLMTSDGRVVGSPGQSSYNVNSSALKPKATVTKTVSRGGFGSTASAKANWGGGKASGGWGG